MTSHYEILGVGRTASVSEIKKAYRKLAKQFHPDHNAGDKNAEEKFLEIACANEVLSDAAQRITYDQKLDGKYDYFSSPRKNVNYYFRASIDKTEVLACEEFELTFVYTGEGRFLKKTGMENFFICGRPVVDFSTVIVDGVEVKETRISYTLAAPANGIFEIGNATIKIENRNYQTEPLHIKVNEANCFFSKKEIVADGVPYQYKMYYQAEGGSQKTRYKTNNIHIVLIPRSHKAKVYHLIARIFKIVFAIWGLLISPGIIFPLFGLFLGSAYGALNAYVLYWIMGVKPKFYFTDSHPVVKEYKAKGFLQGDEASSNTQVGKTFNFIGRLFS